LIVTNKKTRIAPQMEQMILNLGDHLKIDTYVAQIIKAPNLDNFSTSDVRSSYMTLKDDASLDPVVVRKKIYSELLKLVKKGWLKKKTSNSKGLTRFTKTELFNAGILTSVAINKSTESEPQDKHHNLTDKLKHYKTELLLTIGEADAYKELYNEFPDLYDEIQDQYNEARDNNTKILGKIRAIEGLLVKVKM
jgi:hypothetical protein